MPRFLVILLCVLSCGLVIWPSCSRRVAAQDALVAAAGRLERAVSLETRLADLRARVPLAPSPATDDVAALVQSAAREVGLPAQAVAEVSPQEPATLAPRSSTGVQGQPATIWRRQAVQVRLNPIPLADVGAFVCQLRNAAPAWTISQLELRAEPRRTGTDESPESAHYALSCRLTRTTLDRSPN